MFFGIAFLMVGRKNKNFLKSGYFGKSLVE